MPVKNNNLNKLNIWCDYLEKQKKSDILNRQRKATEATDLFFLKFNVNITI